jgi:glyoxylate/succinic semialdehyde reductase
LREIFIVLLIDFYTHTHVGKENPGVITYVEMSTIDAQTSENIKMVIERDQLAEYLAAPVSGGQKDAKEGELLILAAGSERSYEKCLGDFEKMGKQSWLMGPECKNATDAKMALQIMMGGQAALLAECLSFCEYAGVDEKVWFDVLDKGVMMNPLLRSVGNRMFKGVENNRQWPQTLFQTYLQQKDLKLAIETAEKVHCEVPVTAAVHQRYVKASRKGHANEDFASLRDAYDEKKK